MRNIFTVFLILYFANSGILMSQEINLDADLIIKNQFSFIDEYNRRSTFERGDTLHLIKLDNYSYMSSKYYVVFEEDTLKLQSSISKRVNLFSDKVLYDVSTIEDFWKLNYVLFAAFENYTIYDRQAEIRRDLRDLSNKFYNEIKVLNEGLIDPYIESELQNLIDEIFPKSQVKQITGAITLEVFISSEPMIFSLPNNRLLLSSGLISILKNEDELRSILTSEIAHLVFEHPLRNFNANLEEVKRVEKLKKATRVLSAAADILLTSKTSFKTYGSLAIGATLVSQYITPELTNELGIDYTYPQMAIVDQITTELNKRFYRDTTSLNSALKEIADYNRRSGNDFKNYSVKEHFPVLDSRTEDDLISKQVNQNYLNRYSSIIRLNAEIELFNNNYRESYLQVSRLIENSYNHPKNYLIAAKSLIYIEGEDVELALSYLNSIKNIDEEYLEALKYKGIVLYKMRKYSEAITTIEQYQSLLLDNVEISPAKFEVQWCQDMIRKIKSNI